MTIGTFFLQRGMWIPYQAGLLTYVLAIPTLLLLPDSLPATDSGDMSRVALLAPDALLTPEEPSGVVLLTPEAPSGVALLTPEALSPEIAPQLAKSRSSLKDRLSVQFDAVTTEYANSLRIFADMFVHDRLFRLCLAIFFFNIIGLGVRIVLQQWASKFFHLTLAETSFVLSFELFVNGLVLIPLPYLSRRLLKPMLGSTRRADLWVAKASLLLNISGALLIAVAPTKAFFIVSLTIYSIGVGLYESLKSFATGFFQKEEITRLYVGISLVDTVGGLIAAPLWSGIFSFALSTDFLGPGLPFLLCSLSFLCAFIAVILLERYVKAISGLTP